MKPDQHRESASDGQDPPARLRLKLATAEDVRRELARIYREGKSGHCDVSEVSKLANVLQILNRCISTDDLEARIRVLEEATKGGRV